MRQLSSSDNCVHRQHIDILNLFDPELQLINTKPIIKNKLKEFLGKFKVQAILDIEYKQESSDINETLSPCIKALC